MKVLHVSPSFYPATRLGGAIWSGYGLCNALAAESDVELSVLTTNMGGEFPHQRLSDEVLQANAPRGYAVEYAKCWWGRDIAPGLMKSLWHGIRATDVIHLIGTYSFPTIPTLMIARGVGRPVLWSPRGALLASNNWHSATRAKSKKAWEYACRMIANRHKTVLHVTSNAELSASFARMPELKAVVVPNGVAMPVDLPGNQLKSAATTSNAHPLKVLFIGRLDPIKALENLIEAIAILPRDFALLQIVGSGSRCYEASLHALVSARGLGASVQFSGHLDGGAKSQAFSDADVCVLPSFSENFGMAVAEALAHGVPVIAARGVPWPELEKRGCGIWTDNSPQSLANALAVTSRSDRTAMGHRGRQWMQSEYSWSNIAQRFVAIYDAMIRGHEECSVPFYRIGDMA